MLVNSYNRKVNRKRSERKQKVLCSKAVGGRWDGVSKNARTVSVTTGSGDNRYNMVETRGKLKTASSRSGVDETKCF